MRKDHMIAVYVTRNYDLAHIGDKPYACTGCDKDIIYELYESEMILYYRMKHTDEIPYQ